MAAGQITGTRKVPRSREVWSEGPSRSKYCSDLLFSRPHGWSAAWWIGIPPRLTFDADGLSAGEAAAIDHRHRMSAWDSRIWGAGAPYEEAIPIHHAADQPWGLLKRRSEQYLDLLGPSLQTFFYFSKHFYFCCSQCQIKFDHPVLHRLSEGSFTSSRRKQIQYNVLFIFFL